MDETLDTLGRTIADGLGASVSGYSIAHHELTVQAEARDIVSVMRFLRDDARCLFWNIVDVTAVDWPGRERRFDVVYHLLSTRRRRSLRSSRSFPAPTGSSARLTISTAWCSPAIPTCGGC